ncbi:MAG: ferritin-like domain-containing protein [Acidobacteriaceae bacterium]
MKKEEEVVQQAGSADRRKFLRGAGLTGMGLAGAALIGGKLGDVLPGVKVPNVEAAAINDVDILNFALNLEYLEAEFYTMAVTGKTLEQSGFNLTGKGTYGRTTGGAKINFGGAGSLHSQLGRTANGLMETEQFHVKFLRSALGSYAVAKPAINLDALGKVDTYLKFIVVARAQEQTGESAYAGAAALIQNKAYLTAAAQILAVEAEHVGNLRLFCDAYNVPTAKIDWRDVLPPPSGSNEFTINGNGLAPTRDANAVLAIVYANKNKGTSRGGFYPQGLNGTINVITAQQ